MPHQSSIAPSDARFGSGLQAVRPPASRTMPIGNGIRPLDGRGR